MAVLLQPACVRELAPCLAEGLPAQSAVSWRPAAFALAAQCHQEARSLQRVQLGQYAINFAYQHCVTSTTLGKMGEHPNRYGFFFLNSPPMASIGLLGFGCCCWGEALLCAPPPQKQPNCDFSIPAATPPTSGINLGSFVVPL